MKNYNVLNDVINYIEINKEKYGISYADTIEYFEEVIRTIKDMYKEVEKNEN